MKLNERAWAGQLISWIHEVIRNHGTVFQDATNDAGIKLESGRTKFPDILLFTDKVSGIIFNGWELKFPDTQVDDRDMLINALEKAERLKSNSFVTWNGSEAIIWGIVNDEYNLERLKRIKEYPTIMNIGSRDDLSDPIKYKRNEHALKERLIEILHDLEQLYLKGVLKQAINISGSFIEAVKKAAEIILPQFESEIIRLKGANRDFRNHFNQWKIYESSTLKILESSSRRYENVVAEEVLSKFTFYNLIGKTLFYLTLSENLSGSLEKLELKNSKNVKEVLEDYFSKAGSIDYQAVFQPYFTDVINFSKAVNEALYSLLKAINDFDFKVLPTDVIGTILENLVPREEKQKFGQYFTSLTLANLVSFPAIQTSNDNVFDPTSGTGTFLNSFYNILKYHGNIDHSKLLNQIWGNDISHFPAILSVINLYKQKVNETDNFPRVIRDDFFNLEPGNNVVFPNSKDYNSKIEQPIPVFDAMISNFPFIQQEDIPNDVLTELFRKKFEQTQQAFLKDNQFRINERSDYFTYCVYNSVRFLRHNGFLAAITSNAWLGKEYGLQFKKFLIENFCIKYVVKSNAEHWFSDSKVSTVYLVLQYKQCDEPIRFVTINFKLEERFDQNNINKQLQQIEAFYNDIDNCNNPRNSGWRQDGSFGDLYHKIDGTASVSLITKQQLADSIESQDNWDTFFISSNLFESFDEHLIALYPDIIDAFRGARTGYNNMFIISDNQLRRANIEEEFLIPYVKGPAQLTTLEFNGNYNHYLFVCDLSIENIQKEYPGAYRWIKKFENAMNTNGSKTIQESCSGHRPFWYSLRPKKANIVTAINPYERFFFSFSEEPFTIDQRLIAINVSEDYDVELIAALLNSVVTFLTIEMRGTARNLGSLDLNANYFKRLKILNPTSISAEAISRIKIAFRHLKSRPIGTFFEEMEQEDRIAFDEEVLSAFNIDTSILPSLYNILADTIHNRVSMKNR